MDKVYYGDKIIFHNIDASCFLTVDEISRQLKADDADISRYSLFTIESVGKPKSNANVLLGEEVQFKSYFGYYLSVDTNGRLSATSYNRDRETQFRIIRPPNARTKDGELTYSNLVQIVNFQGFTILVNKFIPYCAPTQDIGTTFSIFNGRMQFEDAGHIRMGDKVYLQSLREDGKKYFVEFDQQRLSKVEKINDERTRLFSQYVLEDPTGSLECKPIAYNDTVYLRCYFTGNYVCMETPLKQPNASCVVVNRTAAAQWETFVIYKPFDSPQSDGDDFVRCGMPILLKSTSHNFYLSMRSGVDFDKVCADKDRSFQINGKSQYDTHFKFVFQRRCTKSMKEEFE
jgi:hypothetical protein